MKFSDLQLLPQLLRNVEAAGYSAPTPIQAGAIPPALTGRDVLGTAQTGTGKTAAFCLPVLQRVDAMAGDEPRLRALVLTPTRELAAQVDENLRAYGKDMDLWHAVVFGGVNIKPQIRELKQGVDVLVATPGRLLDLLGQGVTSLADVQLFVLDEADRMLDMGFLPAMRKIIDQLPKQRQTLFFSATMAPEIRRLADKLLKDPAVVSVDPVSSTAETVDQHVYFVDKPNKRHLLIHLLQDADQSRTLVFTRTKHGANQLTRHLIKANVGAAAIHGNKSQGARTRALEGFRKGDPRVLVATDVAARGIDVDDISHVVNYDLPNEPEAYVHRIGRTGRAGRAGVALSFCDREERAYLKDIEKLIGSAPAPVLDHPYPPDPNRPEEPPEENGGRGGGGGQRRGGARRPRANQGGGGRARGGSARATTDARDGQPKGQANGEGRRARSGGGRGRRGGRASSSTGSRAGRHERS